MPRLEEWCRAPVEPELLDVAPFPEAALDHFDLERDDLERRVIEDEEDCC